MVSRQSSAASNKDFSINRGQESFFEDGCHLEESKEPLVNPPSEQIDNSSNTSNPRASFLDRFYLLARPRAGSID